jgi:hypothetical protein
VAQTTAPTLSVSVCGCIVRSTAPTLQASRARSPSSVPTMAGSIT